jgi:hypothetical protein
MPDWKKLVRESMESTQRLGQVHDDVISELAAHLDETYEDARSRGLTKTEAFELTLQEVDDWRVLAANIHHAKSEEDYMNHRTKALWLPGLVTLLGASLLLMLTQFVGVQPRLVWMGKFAMVFYWHWLVGLPLFGALGAYLSQRARGPLNARLAAALSPALVMLITMLLILPCVLLIDGPSSLIISSFVIGATNWVALPGVALLAGATPFLKGRQPIQT